MTDSNAMPAVRRAIAQAANPSFEALTLSEVKAHLRLADDSVDHDQYCLDMIKRAREAFESKTNIIVASGTYKLALDDWPHADFIELPVRPVTSITSITYTLDTGATETWSSSAYSLNNYDSLPRIVLKHNQSWPSNRAYVSDIVITFVAGYASRSVVPHGIKHAMLVDIDRRFEKRGAEDEKSTSSITYDSIMSGYQRQTYP